MMLYKHYSLVPWDYERWPNFKPSETWLYCRCCGEFYLDEHAMDTLQSLRDNMNCPLHINSGHRCAIHNARVGGAPLSMHKKIAFDISLQNVTREKLLYNAKLVGFKGFGFYKTFLHLDLGKPRMWFGTGAKKIWDGLIS